MKKLLLLFVGIVCSLSSVWAGTETVTWDFSEYTTQTLLSDALNYGGDQKYVLEYEKGGMKLYLYGTASGKDSKNNDTEFVKNTTGFHCNGKSSSTTRFIKFIPTKNGVLKVTGRGNSKSTTRIVAIGTSVVTFSSIPNPLTEGVLAAAETSDGSSALSPEISAEVTAGQTYYAYFAEGGSSITKVVFEYEAGNTTTTTVNNAVSAQTYFADSENASTLGSTGVNSVTFGDIATLNGTNMQIGNAQYQFSVGGSNYTGFKVSKGQTYTFVPKDGVEITAASVYASSNSTGTSKINGVEVSARGDKNVPSSPTPIDLTVDGEGNFYFTVNSESNASQALVVIKLTYNKVKTVDVAVSSAGYATLFFNEDVIIPEGVTAYTVGEVASTAKLNEIQNGKIKANTGVILQAEKGTYNFVTTTGAEDMTSALTGTTANKDVEANAVYTLGANSEGVVGLRQYTGTSVRAYSAYYEPSSPAKSFIKLNFGDETTGISTIESAKTVANGAAYNLAGQRVNANAKGIVVVNGKKFLNK